jgi:ABC-type antimicrobial peptide transport system permease subunit
MGIRVALGARKRELVMLVVGRALGPIVSGLVMGAVGAMLSAGILSTLLYGVSPSDPSVIAGIIAALGTTAIVASWIPARRAASVDPLVALREE